MDTPSSNTGNSGRRKFLAIVAGVASAFFIGDKALAAKKPVAKKSKKKPVKKAPVKKAPAKPVAKSTPSPKASATPSPTPSESASPTVSPSPSPSPTPTPTDSPSPAPSASAPPAPVVPANAKALTVAGKSLTTAELAIGATTAATFPKNGVTTAVLVTRVDQSTYVALKPVCTHAGGPVELSGGSLVCIWHNSRFNQKTGAVINGPADSPLPKENVSLIGDTVYYVP
ncbi:MAG: Rieske (2Fe-2S) protein [Actinomycetota bacterium]